MLDGWSSILLGEIVSGEEAGEGNGILIFRAWSFTIMDFDLMALVNHQFGVRNQILGLNSCERVK